jgi:hypothetical protein
VCTALVSNSATPGRRRGDRYGVVEAIWLMRVAHTHGLIDPGLLRRELLAPQADNTMMFALENLLGAETWLRAGRRYPRGGPALAPPIRNQHHANYSGITMLSWGVIAYGAALSAVLAVLLALAARARTPAVLVAVAVGAFAGPVAWNAILRATAANQFFVDAPIAAFPVSWQDTGSGVFALAALALVLSSGPLRTASGGRVALLSVLGAVAALIVDVYLY